MPLSPAQLATLKADVLAQPDLSPLAGSTDGRIEIARLYNLAAADNWQVWDAAVPVDAILNAVNWVNFTPNDQPNQSTEVAGQTWENRAMLVQIKQINLQMMLQGRATFDATRANNRAGLQDATENLPTGNNGNARTGGWTVIQPVLSRTATRAEKLFSAGTGTDASPATLDAALGGRLTVSAADVENALNLP